MKLLAISSPFRNIAAIVALLALAGCAGESSGRLPVHGKVAIGSQPVAKGSINGPVAGHYNVMISLLSSEKSVPKGGANPGERQLVAPWTGTADVSAEELVRDFEIPVKP
jgi:hypothetical protein